MSFSLTVEQFRSRKKTVTRRQGWAFLKPGDVFMGVVKGQGLKKGEKVQRLHPAQVVSTRREPVVLIGKRDVIREGFPGRSAEWFVEMYCKANRVRPGDLCNRIEFRHLPEGWKGAAT
jgi:hypothetical protein